jgi:hypothetical protein
VPPSSNFDAAFDIDLTTLVGGRPAGGLVMLDDDVAFLRAWHEELAPPLATDRGNIDDLTFASAYQWWRWPVASPAAELVPGQIPTTGQWDPFHISGRTIVPVVSSDFSTTQLVELLLERGMRPSSRAPEPSSASSEYADLRCSRAHPAPSPPPPSSGPREPRLA